MLRWSVPSWNMYLPFAFLRPWHNFSCPSALPAYPTVSICPSAPANRAPLIHCHMYIISLTSVERILGRCQRKQLSSSVLRGLTCGSVSGMFARGCNAMRISLGFPLAKHSRTIIKGMCSGSGSLCRNASRLTRKRSGSVAKHLEHRHVTDSNPRGVGSSRTAD